MEILITLLIKSLKTYRKIKYEIGIVLLALYLAFDYVNKKLFIYDNIDLLIVLVLISTILNFYFK